MADKPKSQMLTAVIFTGEYSVQTDEIHEKKLFYIG